MGHPQLAEAILNLSLSVGVAYPRVWFLKGGWQALSLWARTGCPTLRVLRVWV
jgi:hypothetical protein